MRLPEPGADDTVLAVPTSRRRLAAWSIAAATVVVGVAVAGSAAFWLWPKSSPLPPAATTSIPVASAPAFQIETATEAEISRHVTTGLTVFRFADNPAILVLDFASLHEQGKMLNRVAAFVEKARLPHDRVLTDSELNAAIQAKGDTVETYYVGHDYAAASLARFFELADAARIELDPLEEKLRALLRQEGWLAAGVAAGLISVPAVGSDPRITAAVRAVILRHELSHGEFFSKPEYADYVHRFWQTELTGEERGSVRGFLAKEDYDVREEEVMYNEMQAYLMFTRDPTLFAVDMVEMTQDRLTTLQGRFLAGMPAGWLRNALAGYQDPRSAQ